MAETPTGETLPPVAPSNEPSTPAVPAQPVNNGADVEAAKREAEQARMRANQLENELKKVRDEQDAAQRKQLEEQNEFKTLYEKNEAELKQLKDTQAANERATTLTQATEDVFKEYPASVIELAKTAGLGLSDDSDTARSRLKETLDAFKARMPDGQPGVTGVNPSPSNPASAGQPSRLGRPQSLGVDDGKTTVNPDGNTRKVGEYIGSLDAIKRMKLDSGAFKEA